MRPIDFGQVAKSYARSREDIPASLMDSLFIRNINFAGKKVADLGCGTGALARKIAMRNADVTGVDLSLELLKQAEALKKYNINYLAGTAESTGLGDSQFDIVTAMRAWHWFDRPKALQETKRILKSNGTLLVIDSRFLPGSEVVDRTFKVISKYVELKPAGAKAESKQRINGFPVEWFNEWEKNGFDLRDYYKLNYSVTFTKEEWVERVESISWLAGLEEDARRRALNELSEALSDVHEPFTIPHDCNVCILRLKK